VAGGQERQPYRRARDLALGVQHALDDDRVRLGEQRRRERGEAVPQVARPRGLPGVPGGDELDELAGAQVSGGENAARGAEREQRRREHVIAGQHREIFWRAGHQQDGVAVLEEASAALAAARTSLTGPLRIGAFPTAARTILPSALVTLGREHPGLELMVTELDPVAVPGALRAGAIDVALTFVYDYVPAEPDPALDTEPLLEEPVYLATPAGQRGTAETGIQGWRNAPWIAGSPDTLCHTLVIRACQACGFTPRIRHHADDFATVLALVAAGQGVSLIPRLGVTGTPPGITLTPLATRRRTSIACRKGTRHHPAISAFATAIREHSPGRSC
jgi:DNA-binding transcriptional LysR family regulator